MDGMGDGQLNCQSLQVVEALLHAGHHHRPGVLASNRRTLAHGTDSFCVIGLLTLTRPSITL
eukprot:6459812-Amphidinium_carterae.3